MANWFVALLLILCIGTIVWAFWPASAESLYKRGAALMASSRPADWETAFKEYLDGPVESRLSRRSSQGCGVRLRVDETIKIKSRVALKLGYANSCAASPATGIAMCSGLFGNSYIVRPPNNKVGSFKSGVLLLQSTRSLAAGSVLRQLT